MGLNHTPESKVMEVWIGLELLCSISSISIHYWLELNIRVIRYGCLNFPRAFVFNFELLDIFYARIGHLSEKLWPFEFLKSFRCSFSSVSIYHGPQSYTWVKSNGRLNLPCVSMFSFERLDILCIWIRHSRENLWPFEFLNSFRCPISSTSILNVPQSDTRVKIYVCFILP